MAAPLETDEVAAVGAAVDHRVDLAVLPAGDDDRGLAEKGRQVIPGCGSSPASARYCQVGPRKIRASSAR